MTARPERLPEEEVAQHSACAAAQYLTTCYPHVTDLVEKHAHLNDFARGFGAGVRYRESLITAARGAKEEKTP